MSKHIFGSIVWLFSTLTPFFFILTYSLSLSNSFISSLSRYLKRTYFKKLKVLVNVLPIKSWVQVTEVLLFPEGVGLMSRFCPAAVRMWIFAQHKRLRYSELDMVFDVMLLKSCKSKCKQSQQKVLLAPILWITARYYQRYDEAVTIMTIRLHHSVVIAGTQCTCQKETVKTEITDAGNYL